MCLSTLSHAEFRSHVMFVNYMSGSHRIKITVNKYVSKPSRKNKENIWVKISMLNNIAKEGGRVDCYPLIFISVNT